VSIPALSPLVRCQCGYCSWLAGCGSCGWLSVLVADSPCLGCQGLEGRLAREGKVVTPALHVPEGEAMLTEEISVTEESRLERRRRLTRERVRRYRESKR
jgi:hypothetical protein